MGSAGSGRISHIQTFCLHDGEGIRTTVFFAGCPLRCRWCANPETWDATRATTMSPAEVVARCRKDRIFYRYSGGGVTISGGEPGSQPRFLHALLLACHSEGLHTTLESSGMFNWQPMLPALKLADFLFFDIKLMDAAAHHRFTDTDNKMILANIRRAGALGKEMVIRIPLIPEINNQPANLIATADFVRKHVPGQRIELLPYHDWAQKKYADLGLNWHTYRIPNEEEMTAARSLLTAHGVAVVDYK